MCGILGVYGRDPVAVELVHGLAAIQHRGQDAAGLLTFDKTFHVQKGLGLVSNVLGDFAADRFPGYSGLGHVRYSTIGSNTVPDAQPVVVNYPFGLAMVHNGNVTNFVELRRHLYEEHHRLLDTSNDAALILYTLASELERKDLKRLSVADIFDAVEATQKTVLGSYSAIGIIANVGFLAFCDPNGIRPIVMGRKYASHGISHVFASESVCFDFLGCERVRDLEPGEMVFIDRDMNVHTRSGRRQKQAFCVFEYIYFAREDSVIHNRLVATERVRLGRPLAETFRSLGLEPDIVIDVPSSAYFFASGLAEELGVPYRRGLARNNHIGRSFISPGQSLRELLVRQKLNPIRDIVKGKKIAVADDSIVRGTTSRHIVRLLRQAGAAEVYFVSAAPPIRFPCIYGIDMSARRELIAAHYDEEQIRHYLDADAVVYQSLDSLKDLYKDLPCCYACFSGEYPTAVSREIMEQIEQEKLCSGRG
ncbi:MAG: amidophosphoribosyltransferase [Deltaproteobacteria bacterium]|nr:amidophosphoribosyltransferase [Deltaproteobacteria bacterium]